MAVPFPLTIPVTVVERVIAGVVVALATVPAKPFADATDAVVTVPTETDPPSEMAEPLIVMDEFVSWLLPMPDSVPPSVRLPDDVTVPVSVMPLTVPVPLTDVTVPNGLADH